MKRFIKKLFLVIIVPLIIIIGAVISWDPFKVFFNYPNGQMGDNRELECMQLFDRQREHRSLNSFIIGSSRSLAFKVRDWKKYLDETGHKDVRAFHFDGNGLGLFRTKNILKYIDENTDTIKNLLIIFDDKTFEEIANPPGPLFIEPPKLSGESPLQFYSTFVAASLNPMFVLSGLDLYFTGKYKSYMKTYIRRTRYLPTTNFLTGDFDFGYDREIREDSLAYYRQRFQENEFYTREPDIKEKGAKIGPVQKDMLLQVKHICDKNRTDIKIVICPLYNQIPINTADKKVLMQMFGSKNICDYSGKNRFTDSVSNYYESSHFRPPVARQIMKEIYQK